MSFKPLIVAAVLAAAATGAFAGDQSVAFDTSDWTASFIGTKPLLDGGDDVISFTGLSAGTYDFELTLSGQYVSLSELSVNGVAGTVESSGKILFADVLGTGVSPFSLTLDGVTTGSQANYSGEFSVMAVPEPETYALMLAGLAAVGFVGRRRRRG